MFYESKKKLLNVGIVMIIVRVFNSGIGIFYYWFMKSWIDKEVICCLSS